MKRHHLFFAISTIASGLAIWLYIVTQVPATLKSFPVLSLFFLSLSAWLAGLIASCLFWWRVKAGNREVVYAYLTPSIRQGIIIAVVVSCILFMKAFQIIGVWETGLIVLAGVLFELALGRHNHKPKLTL